MSKKIVSFKFPRDSETAIIDLKFNYSELKKVIIKWVLKHGETIIPVMVTVGGGVIGGSLFFITANIIPPSAYECALTPVIMRGSPAVQARNGGVYLSVLTGLGIILEKDNVPNTFCAEFVSALFAGAKGSTAISDGLFFALLNGCAHKVQEDYLQQKQQPEHVLCKCNKTTGLQSGPPQIDLHRNNIQRESITNSPTLLLLLTTNSYLQEDVKDPNGEKQQEVDHTVLK